MDWALLATLLLAIVSGLIGYGKLQQSVDDLKEDMRTVKQVLFTPHGPGSRSPGGSAQ